MTKKGYILEDVTSKFGTLLLLQNKEQEIDPSNGLSVQVGRTLITFSLRQKDFVGPIKTTSANFEEAKLGSPLENV